MAEHTATIEWRSKGGFADGRYSRAHLWRFDGGATVPASASPHVVPPPLSDPAGVDPEEALVASASACHMLWFLHLARDAGLDVASYRDEALATMGKDERGRIAITRIALRPEIEFAGRQPDREELARIHHEAHEKCFVANSLRSEVVVEESSCAGSPPISVRAEPVEAPRLSPLRMKEGRSTGSGRTDSGT